MKISENTKGSGMLVVTSMIWGVSFVAQDAGLRFVGPIFLNFARMLLGGVALLPVVLFLNRRGQNGRSKAPFFTKDEKLGGFICGFLLFFSTALQQLGMSFYGQNDAAAGKSGFITAMYIVIVPIAGLFFKKRPALSVWISVLLSFTGLYLLCFKGGSVNLQADGFVAGCAFSFSAHIMVVDHFSPKCNGLKLSMLQFFVAGLFSLCCFALPSERALLTPAHIISALPYIAYLGVFSCAVAYTLQVVAQKRVTNATVASVLMSLESVFAALTGALFGESMSPLQILGCAIMFAAVTLAQIDFKALRPKNVAA